MSQDDAQAWKLLEPTAEDEESGRGGAEGIAKQVPQSALTASARPSLMSRATSMPSAGATS